MRTLADFITSHTLRGACTCGLCADALHDAAVRQPKGHTIDLMFFKLKAIGEPKAADLFTLVEQHAPVCLDGREHNYIEVGAVVGDQGLGLQLMGLGELLGLWELMTPRNMLGRFGLDDNSLMRFAHQGMITIVRRPEGRAT